MKSLMKFAMALTSLGSINAASYWDNNNCQDTEITVPANGSAAVIYFVGDDVTEKDNAGKYYFEWHRSELSTGAAT